MKNTLALLLLGLLLFGCSQKPTSLAGPAIDLLVASKDIAWHGGYVIHIAKRNGTSLEGIQIVRMVSDGQKTTLTADTGTLSPGSLENTADDNSVKMTLHNMRSETVTATGKSVSTSPQMILVLQK